MSRSPHEFPRDDVIFDVRGEMAKRSRPAQRVAHHVGRVLTSPWVLAALLLVAVLWMVANSGWFGGWRPWDPYPFALLSALYSVLAPLIALLVLMRQYHDQQVAELTAEVMLQVLLHNETKLTVALRLLDPRQRGGAIDDAQLESVLQTLDPKHLVDSMQRRLERDEKED